MWFWPVNRMSSRLGPLWLTLNLAMIIQRLSQNNSFFLSNVTYPVLPKMSSRTPVDTRTTGWNQFSNPTDFSSYTLKPCTNVNVYLEVVEMKTYKIDLTPQRTAMAGLQVWQRASNDDEAWNVIQHSRLSAYSVSGSVTLLVTVEACFKVTYVAGD
jgi:hypothetical protein